MDDSFGMALSVRHITELAAAGVACYLVFHRFEPRHPLIHLALLLGAPILLSLSFPRWNGGRIYTGCISVAVYLASLITSAIAYRLSPFHPLAQYPGPLLAKVTKLWSLRIGVSGKLPQCYKALHEKYGDIVRTGPNELSFNEVSLIEPMMGIHGMPKGPYWEGRSPGGTANLISIRDRSEHIRRRKPWTRGLNTEALRDYEPTLRRRVSQLVERLAGHVGKGDVDLAQWFNFFTYDFMNDMAFGGGTNIMQDGDQDGLWQMLENSHPGTYFQLMLPWTAHYAMHLPWLAKNSTLFRKNAIQRAIARKEQGSTHKDLFYHLSDEAGVQNRPPATAEIISDASLIVVAGADTTSTVLSHIFYYLMANQDMYRKLQAEVDSVFPPGEDAMDVAKHGKMPYLNGVINEALRMLPPVMSGSHRGPARGSGGRMLGKHFIPEGTDVFIHTYTIHRDARNFSEPDTFWPERWLPLNDVGVGSRGKITHNASAFIPFSAGPANCAGKALALQELRMVVCAVVQRFSMRFADCYRAESWEESLRDVNITMSGMLLSVLQERRSPSDS